MRSGGLGVRSVIDAVEEALREQVLDGEIPMGTAVRETRVAQTFEVARPTAKAAIERLVTSGLLRRDAHRSARVPVLTADDVTDLYLSRILVEGQVARTLADRGQYPEEADEAIRSLRALGTDALPAQYVDPDVGFHAALTRQLGSARIGRVHDGLLQEMRFCMAQVQAERLLSPTVIVTEHEAIATAIRNGRPDEAATAVAAHLNRACNALTASIKDRESSRG